MLQLVREEIVRRQLGNVRLAFAQAEALPFEDATFDLVTCRIAPHHFENIDVFLDEAQRVLKPSGHFALLTTWCRTAS
jgi:ubiquinone/menaquinone biosynthesis C-methylase UbiE